MAAEYFGFSFAGKIFKFTSRPNTYLLVLSVDLSRVRGVNGL